MIEETYCSFEIAKLLKEKGFYVYGDGSFGSEIKIWMEYSPFGKIRDVSSSRPSMKGYPAPTLQMAMKWLREVHNIAIVVTPSMFWGKYNVSIYKKGNDYPIGFDGDSLCPSYEQACEAAIKYCLKHLI